MSGICGWVSGGTRSDATDKPVLDRMLDALRRRGPDGMTRWFDPRHDAALGHTALHSFSPAGATPPAGSGEDRGVALVADGQAFVDGRDQGAAGLLRAYHDKPDHFPQDLDGPCALALWDQDRQTLLLARDPLGEKPLYYALDPATNEIVFASEIKSLLKHPAVSPEVDNEGLSLFLTFGWMPSPKTLFGGIKKLAPGEMLRWTARDGARVSRYWRVPRIEADPGDLASFTSEARELFIAAVEKYVRGLDEVGLFLSGGMDSTVLLLVLRELGISRIHTFTLGLPTDEAQERDLDIPYARLMAEQFGTNHHELNLNEWFDPTDLVPHIMSQYDDPILTPNCLTKYLLAALAKRAGVNSILTGSGAAGGCGPYRRFRDPGLRRRILRKTEGIEGDAERFVKLRGKILAFDEIAELLAGGSDLDADNVAAYLKPYLETVDTPEFPRAYLLANLLTTCPEKACAVLDRSGMLCSVDVRSPHLDRGIVEFQMGVPSSFDGGNTFIGIKCLLDAAFHDQIPQAIHERRETGFPTYYWHRGELRSLQQRLLSDEVMASNGLFRPDFVRRMLEEEARDTESKSVGKHGWVLTQLSLWHALHVRGESEWLAAAESGSPEALLGRATVTDFGRTTTAQSA